MQRPLKGYWTLLGNGAVVAGAALLQWASGVDWTQYVSPTAAMIIIGGVNIGLRIITTGPVGSKQ